MSIRELSRYLNIKPATLYAWATRGRIPNLKIHGLIRFQKDEIDRWIESFQDEKTIPFSISPKERPLDMDALIERVKRAVYNSRHSGRPDRNKAGKEGHHGAV